MEDSKCNLIQYRMQGILPASCVLCLLFTVVWATGEMRVSAFGGEISPSALSPVVSPGGAGEQRRRWLWAALGGVRKLELLQLGAWGAGLSDGRGNDGQRDEMDPADKGPALNSKGRNLAKEDLVVVQYSTFLLLGVQYKCIYFFKMPQFEINKKPHPPSQIHPINLYKHVWHSSRRN